MERASAHEEVFDARATVAEERAAAARRFAAVVGVFALIFGLGLVLYMRLHGIARQLAEERRLALLGEQEQRHRAEFNASLSRDAMLAARKGEVAKDEFLSLMGHETRTPLNGILPVLQLVYDSVEDPRLKALCRAGLTCAHSLGAMMDNINLLTAFRVGKLQADSHPVGVGSLVRQRVTAFQGGYDPAELRFRFRDETEGAQFGTDGDKLGKCVDALLDNAARFTGKGLVAVSVQRDGAGGFHIAVGDNGPGMDPAFVDRYRRPFEQADLSRSREREGLGIGLAVVDTLTSVMGGRLSVRTGLGEGTTMILSFPGARSRNTPRRVEELRRELLGMASGHLPGASPDIAA